MKICNAFSLQMLPTGSISNIKVEPYGLDFLETYESFIGHQDLIEVLKRIRVGDEDGCDHYPLSGLTVCRESLALKDGESIVVAQVIGGRLPEGATTLPEGVKIKFLKVTNVTTKSKDIFEDARRYNHIKREASSIEAKEDSLYDVCFEYGMDFGKGIE